jgi:hypothetical protein
LRDLSPQHFSAIVPKPLPHKPLEPGELAQFLLQPSRRFVMIAIPGQDQYYGVEVSGWNATENFFVEKTSLEWTPEGLKSVRLKSDLRQGTIVFLRLLHHGPETNQFPVAYQTTELGGREHDGRVRVWLEQMHPRETREPYMHRALVPVT